jgi:NADH:ubiquinone oxidoreductase subunit F (NADH-binding)/NADH:ubiquinone oxidoreductase subunit E
MRYQTAPCPASGLPDATATAIADTGAQSLRVALLGVNFTRVRGPAVRVLERQCGNIAHTERRKTTLERLRMSGIQKAGSPRQARGVPRGRAVDPAARDEIVALLDGKSRDRDQLLEHLHRLQDRYGYLSARHLRALAEWMRLPMAAVYETATFYAHFDFVDDGQAPPAPLTIRVCDSPSCQLAGSAALQAALVAGTDPAAVRVLRAPCMGRCHEAPVAQVGRRHLGQATPGRVRGLIEAGHLEPERIAWQHLLAYQSEGGYRLLADLRAGRVTAAQLGASLDTAGLRGLGGAGFPTHRKWEFVLAESGPRYVVINADEGEPGTFKDHHYMATAPHQVLEGALVIASIVEASAIYLYLRDEYPGLLGVLGEAISQIEAAGLAPPGYIVLRRGAGAYICGEESALIESLEGKPGKPRHRPPYVAQRGLFGRPTLVNNVETVYWIPEIHRRGGEWFASQGRHGRKGLHSFSVSGRVQRPGVHLAPAGITLRELIDEHCGGMAEGHELLAYLPGGASGGILPAAKANVPLDFDTLQPDGCFIGSAGIIVLSTGDKLHEVAVQLMAFFADESCGQCTPCRVGTDKMLALLKRPRWDEAQLRRLSQVMMDASICGLGQAAPNPVLSLLTHFRERLAHEGIRLVAGEPAP